MTPPRVRVIPAVHLIVERDGEVLLLRRANTGFADGWLSVPAGHLEGQETAAAAMLREAREEVGLVLAREELRLVHTMHRATPESPERLDLFFAVSADAEPRNLEPHKCSELRWARWDALPQDVVPYVRQALACVRAGEAYSDNGWPG